MGDKSEIQWTDATWNPVTGCSKVSPGCAHCYAESLTARYAGQPGWIDEHRPWTPANAAHNVRLRPERLDQPLRWRRPRMVFVNSMSDLFHEQIPDEYIARVFGVMAACNGQDGAPAHTFQVLTKRPERMQALLTSSQFENTRRRASGELGHELPLPNVWLGTSIENRRYVGRADELRATPAAVRFISAEPLLGPLRHGPRISLPFGAGDTYRPDLDLTGIDWLIVGGESGQGARHCDPDWVRDLRDACTAGRNYGPHTVAAEHVGPLPEIGGTAFFFKQWGGRTPKAGGRELDGRTWDEMPLRLAVAA